LYILSLLIQAFPSVSSAVNGTSPPQPAKSPHVVLFIVALTVKKIIVLLHLAARATLLQIPPKMSLGSTLMFVLTSRTSCIPQTPPLSKRFFVCNHDMHSHFMRPPQHRLSSPAPIAFIDLIEIQRNQFYVRQQSSWPILEGIDPETTKSSAIFCEADPHPQSWGRRSFLFHSLCTLASQSTPLQEVRNSPAPEIIIMDETGLHITASGKPVTSTSTQQAGSSDTAATSTSSAPDVETDDDCETYTAQFVATPESFEEDLQAASRSLERIAEFISFSANSRCYFPLGQSDALVSNLLQVVVNVTSHGMVTSVLRSNDPNLLDRHYAVGSLISDLVEPPGIAAFTTIPEHLRSLLQDKRDVHMKDRTKPPSKEKAKALPIISKRSSKRPPPPPQGRSLEASKG